MTREVQGIPTVPRQVFWRAVCWQRWPLCLSGLALLVWGGLFTWMLFLAFGGKASDNARLDLGPTVRTSGSVTAVESGRGFLDGAPADRIAFTFEHGGHRRDGECFGRAGGVGVGEDVAVELLPGEPNLSRIPGTRLDLLPAWLRPEVWLQFSVVPGLTVLLVWFAVALRLRRMMANGDVAVAEVLVVRRVRFVLPAMLSVTYRFRDHHSMMTTGRHWVPMRGALGMRLMVLARRGTGGRMPAVHSRRQPRHSRLTLHDDYAREEAGSRDLEAFIS